MTPKQIAIIATFDTKSAEATFMVSLIQKQGHVPVCIDVGPLTRSSFQPGLSNRKIAQFAGWKLPELIASAERDQIMSAMGTGAAKALTNLLKKDRLDGVIGVGGNQGTAMAAMAMRSLPIGFPKFLVSTVASGDLRPYMGHKDIGVMFSVADLVGGPNPVTRSVLSNAVSALVGMIENGQPVSLTRDEKIVAVTALGNTEPSAKCITELLREKGYQAITFHASGAGGSAMEELIREGVFRGLIDLTPHELTEEVVGAGAYVPVEPGRLTAAGKAGIAQVVSTGALEYLCFGPKASIPGWLRQRKTYFHNPLNANVKASRNEMKAVGRVMAERLNAAKGPVELLIPLQGWSVYGGPGGPLYDPIGNAQLLNALKGSLRPDVPVTEIDAHINDSGFARTCVERLLRLI